LVVTMTRTNGANVAGQRGLTSAQLAVWRALIDTTAELRRILGAELQASGLSPADYQVLLALTEAQGRRLRSSALAATIDWERSRLSHHLGRMERRGLIQRDECATDSRGAEVSLTSDGASAFRSATVPHARAIKRHFADALTTEQLEALADVLESLQRHLHLQLGPATITRGQP
jgi:DNA-binding MarR family transcriptional regulator